MKKNKVQIKDKITLSDKVHAIEYIVDSCFTDGEYTPYYIDTSLVIAIVRYFLEGFKIEKGDDLYKIGTEDKDFVTAIESFRSISKEEYEKLSDKKKELYDKYAGLMQYVNDMVHDKLDYQKKMAIAQLTSGNNAAVEEKVLDLLFLEAEKLKLEVETNKGMATFTKNLEAMTTLVSEEEQAAIMKNMAKADFSFDAETIANAMGKKLFDEELQKTNSSLVVDYTTLQKEYAELKHKEGLRNVLAEGSAMAKKQSASKPKTKSTKKKKE